MRLDKRLAGIILSLFFSVGLILGLASKQNNNLIDQEKERYSNPETEDYKLLDTSQERDGTNTKDDFNKNLVNTDNELNINDPANFQTTDKNNQPDDNCSPEEKYFKQGRPLQREFPDSFIMDFPTNRKVISLTFDDGPDNKSTPQVLDILKRFGVPATFFVIGKNLEPHKRVVERMVDEGHQVANHSWSHLRPTKLKGEDFLSEILPANKVLEDFIDLSQPLYYRPPYGLLTSAQVEEIRNKGYIVISWSIDSLDWTNSKPEEIRDKVINSAKPGAIVLMHSAGGKDGRRNTIKALPEIIENLTGQGYKFLTIRELLKGK